MTRAALLCALAALALLGWAAHALTRAALRRRPLTVPYEWVGGA